MVNPVANMKRLAARKGWGRVALVLTVGPIVLAWVYAGKALVVIGEWMQDRAGA